MIRTYKCEKCGEFEHDHDSMNEKYIEFCKCGRKVRQVFGGSFRLHCGGFYSTDSQILDRKSKH